MSFQQLEFPLIKEGIWNDNLNKNCSWIEQELLNGQEYNWSTGRSDRIFQFGNLCLYCRANDLTYA